MRQCVLGMMQFKLIADPILVWGYFVFLLFSSLDVGIGDLEVLLCWSCGSAERSEKEGPVDHQVPPGLLACELQQGQPPDPATSSWDLSVIESSHVLSAAICWSCSLDRLFFFFFFSLLRPTRPFPLKLLFLSFLPSCTSLRSLISDNVSWVRPYFLLENNKKKPPKGHLFSWLDVFLSVGAFFSFDKRNKTVACLMSRIKLV